MKRVGSSLQTQRKRSAQVSIEYLFIMIFALLLVTPLIVIYYQQTTRLSEETRSAEIQRAALQMAEAADTVYFLGPPSMRTLTVNLPDGVKSVSIDGQHISFTLSSSAGSYEQNAWSVANVTGSFTPSQGPHTLSFTVLNDSRVNITEWSG